MPPRRPSQWRSRLPTPRRLCQRPQGCGMPTCKCRPRFVTSGEELGGGRSTIARSIDCLRWPEQETHGIPLGTYEPHEDIHVGLIEAFSDLIEDGSGPGS